LRAAALSSGVTPANSPARDGSRVDRSGRRLGNGGLRSSVATVAMSGIRDAVNAELKYDSGIDPADITVKSMSGDVALNGTVPSYPSTSGRPRRRAGSRG
jgi:osmotically-inducible protein OsmY